MKNNFVTEWDKVSDNDNNPIIENPEVVSPDNHFIDNTVYFLNRTHILY